MNNRLCSSAGPIRSATSSRPGSLPAASAASRRSPSGVLGVAYVSCAGTETISPPGYRNALSLPPKAQPVSTHSVELSHFGSATGSWP